MESYLVPDVGKSTLGFIQSVGSLLSIFMSGYGSVADEMTLFRVLGASQVIRFVPWLDLASSDRGRQCSKETGRWRRAGNFPETS